MNRALAALSAIAVLLGCAQEMPIDPEDPRFMNARVEVVGASAVNLRYGEVADLQVRYVDSEGEPIGGAVLDWAIEGSDGGARLGALESVTGEDGTAFMTLTAGDTDGMFTVAITPPAGAGAGFDVSVSDSEQGSLTVFMTYPGTRPLVTFDAFLLEDTDCASIDFASLPAGLRSAPTVTDVNDNPAFAGLAPGSGYGVVVLARTARHLAAAGCRDMVSVQAREDTQVNVTLENQPIPPSFVGEWDLDNQLDFGGALPPSVDTFLNVIGEIGDDDATDAMGRPSRERTDLDGDGIAPEYGVDPGAFAVDLAMRQTCHWECRSGEDYDTCSEINHRTGDLELVYEESFQFWSGAQSRFRGGCGSWDFVLADAQTLVNDQVAMVLPDFALAWTQLSADLANAVTNAHILSELTINDGTSNEFQVPIEHELVEMVVPFRDPMSSPPGMAREVTFALADAGVTGLLATETSTVDGTTLNIPRHSFTLPLGRITLYIYRNVLLQEIFGVSSTGALLASWLDCNALATSLYNSIESLIFPFPVPVSESTLAGYCTTALNEAGTLLENQLAGSIDEMGTLSLEGSATGAAIDDDTGAVGRLEAGVWMGTFEEASMSADVTGTFTGMRAVP